jgi:hypothetical protein
MLHSVSSELLCFLAFSCYLYPNIDICESCMATDPSTFLRYSFLREMLSHLGVHHRYWFTRCTSFGFEWA